MNRASICLRAAVLTSVALLGVAACSSSDDSSTPSSKSNSASGAVPIPSNGKGPTSDVDIAATPRDQLKDGGSATWAIDQTVANFNYYQFDGSGLEAATIWKGLLPRPFDFDGGGTPSVNKDFFTSIEKTSDSPFTLEYKINPKARWSDGKAVSWKDFEGIWQACFGDKPGYKIGGHQGYDQIKSVTKGADDQDVIIKFDKPYTDWQGLFDPLVPASLTASPGTFNTAWKTQPTITAGPFKWGSYDATHKTYSIVRDPRFWGNKAKLDKIVFAVYNDPSAAVQALGPHTVDIDDISGGSEVENVAAAKKYDGVSIRFSTGRQYRQLTLNAKSGPLADQAVRQAVLLSIDRQAITNALMGPLGGSPTPLQNMIFLKNQSGYKETCGKLCKYDPEAAKKLLEGAGWSRNGSYYSKSGTELSLVITIPDGAPNAVSEARIAAATAKAAGIKITSKVVPSDNFFSDYINPGKFQVTIFTWENNQFPAGSTTSIYKLDPKNVQQNYGQAGSTEINDLLDQAVVQTTTKKEADIVNHATELIWQNAGWLPLYERPQAYAVTSDLVNVGAAGFSEPHYEDIGFKK